MDRDSDKKKDKDRFKEETVDIMERETRKG